MIVSLFYNSRTGSDPKEEGGWGWSSGPLVVVLGTASILSSAYKYEHLGMSGELLAFSPSNDSYAIQIKGAGGWPVLKHNQFVVLDKHSHPSFGDLCIFSTGDMQKRILEYLGEGEDAWSMMTLEGSRLTIPKDEIEEMETIVSIHSQTLWRPKRASPLKKS